MTRDEVIEMAEHVKIGSKAHFGFFIYPTSGTKELGAFAELVAAKKRNDTLEEVAQEFDKMKVFGDTAASFAIFVREMKS